MTDNEINNEVVDVEAIEAAPADETPSGNAPKAPKGGGNFASNLAARMDAFWGISAKGSSFKTEIIGGLTTFFAMCYIMVVNPGQMSGMNSTAPLWNAIFIATALGAIVGTLLMCFFAKLPFAQAPGMGLNSFFFVSFMLAGFGTATPFTEAAYAAGLSVILLSGIVFMILSVTGLRTKIAKAMPDCLKKAIPAGIGLFIALIAFKNAGLVQFNPYTFVQLGNIAIGSANPVLDPVNGVINYQTVTWYTVAPILVAFVGFMVIAALNKTKLKKGAIIIGILVSTGLFYLFNIGNASAYSVFEGGLGNPGQAFVDFGKLSFGQAFVGFKYWTAGTVLSGILLVITFCLVDMFDTFGTLQGTAAEAGMLDEDGNPQRLKQALISDSTATLVGAVIGTSTVTTYVESSAGVSAGARTGFSSLIVAVLFFIAMFLSPLASVIPSSAVAPALMYVGVLMLKSIKDVDFKDVTSAVPAFLALIMMPLTYSISNGIAMGMISYTILKLVSIRSVTDLKDFFKKDIIVAVIAILFVVRYFLVYM